MVPTPKKIGSFQYINKILDEASNYFTDVEEGALSSWDVVHIWNTDWGLNLGLFGTFCLRTGYS